MSKRLLPVVLAAVVLTTLSNLSHAALGVPGAANPIIVMSTQATDRSGSTDNGYGVTTLGGFTYAVGSLYNTGGTLADIGIIKYDGHLTQIASSTFSTTGFDYGQAIATDGTSLFITGAVSVPGSAYDTLVAKYDTNLAMVSSAVVTGASGNDYRGLGIAATASNIYVVGYRSPAANPVAKILIAKYDTNLNFISSTTVGASAAGAPSQALAVAVNPTTGDLYVTGYSGTTTNTFGDVWVARINSSLVIQSSFTVSGNVNTLNKGYGIAVAPVTGDVYVAATFPGASANDCWTARYSSSLVFISSRTENLAGATDMAIAAGPGNVYVTGQRSGDYYFASLDLSLNLVSSGVWTSAGSDYGSALAVAGNGDIMTAGTFYNGANYDFFVARLSTGAAPTNVVGTGTDLDTIAWVWDAVPEAVGYEFSTNVGPAVYGVVTPSYAQSNAIGPNERSNSTVRAMYFGGPGPYSTYTATGYSWVNAPTSSSVTAVSSASITVGYNHTNQLNGEQYNIQAWAVTGATLTATSTQAFGTINGLASGTAYTLRVNAQSGGGVATTYDTEITSTTLTAVPTGLAGVAAINQVNWTWNTVSGATGYRVTHKEGVSGPFISAVAGAAFNASINVFNQATWVMVQGVDAGGTSALSASATVYSLANPPTSPSLSSIGVSSLALTWNENSNSTFTVYTVSYGLVGGSTATLTTRDFKPKILALFSSTTIQSLLGGSTYFFNVKATNEDGFATTSVSVTTVTHPTAPAAPTGLAGTALGVSSISWTWNARAGAESYRFYEAGILVASPSGTTRTTTGISTPNKAVFAQVSSVSGASGEGSLSTGVSSYSLAVPVTGSTTTLIGVSSVTVAFTDSGNPALTGHRVEFFTAGGDTVTLNTTALTATATGLAQGTTYTFQVRAVNGDGIATALDAAMLVVTDRAQNVIQPVPGTGGGTVSFTPPSGAVTVEIPPSGFSENVTVTVQVPNTIPANGTPPPSGGALTGTGVAIEILLDKALQPEKGVILSISYPATVGTTFDPKHLVICRYDTTRGVWVPLVSTVDTANGKVIAVTNHFSLFQIMSVTPSAAVSTGKVFPNPFRPALGHTSVTFSNLPAAASLKIYTMAGEQVRELTTNGSGMASWDGNNGDGRNAASGVYLVYVSAPGGGTKTFKVAVQR